MGVIRRLWQTKDVHTTFRGLNELEGDFFRGTGSSLIVIMLASTPLLIYLIACH